MERLRFKSPEVRRLLDLANRETDIKRAIELRLHADRVREREIFEKRRQTNETNGLR